MRILLVAVNAKYIHSCPAVYSLRAGCRHPETVEIAEYTINDRYQDILGGILEREADLIGFSTYIWNTQLVQDLAADIRRVKRENVILFAGGPEASYSPERFLTSCDFVICGEGEIPFRMIAERAAALSVPEHLSEQKTFQLKEEQENTFQLKEEQKKTFQLEEEQENTFQLEEEQENTSLLKEEQAKGADVSDPENANSKKYPTAAPYFGQKVSGAEGLRLQSFLRWVRENVPGAAFRDGSVIRTNPAIPETDADIDSIPFLYDDLALFDHRIIYYESSRGCPFSCTYCLSSIDKRVRFRNMDTVLKELQFFIDREVPLVKFIDRTFNCSHERTMKIWTYLRDHDIGKTSFHFEIGADLLNAEELALLESLRPGLVQLEIGIQSTNPETLRAIQRTMDLPKLCSNIKRLRSAGNINLHVDLIAGLPYEGLESFAKSFNDVYALHADQLQLGFLKVLGGTRMLEMADEYDIRYSARPPYEVLSTKWLSCADLDLLRRICDVLEYYYNSGQFTHALMYLERYWEGAFDFYRKLADFFRRCGYDWERPAAARRYEVLREFVRESGIIDDCSVFEEYLRLDRNLHIHKSRRRSVSDIYDFGEGKVRITIDYEQQRYNMTLSPKN